MCVHFTLMFVCAWVCVQSISVHVPAHVTTVCTCVHMFNRCSVCVCVCVQATLNSGLDLREAVKLPDDEEYHDWIAVHVVDFFNRINIIYGTVCEFCTDASCPVMSGGPKFEYYWADEVQKKPQALPAPQV